MDIILVMNNINPEIFSVFSQIDEDQTVPKNVKLKLKDAVTILQGEDKDIAFRIDKVLEGLDELCEDSNIPNYTKTQLWNLVSLLESLK